MNKLLQNFLYLIIIAAVSVAVIYTSPKQVNLPHGILLPASATSYLSIAPSKIQVYNFSTLPAHYQHIGLINTSIHYTDTTHKALQKDYQQLVNYAKSLAAKHGANGIVLGQAMPSGPPTYTLDINQIRAIKTE